MMKRSGSVPLLPAGGATGGGFGVHFIHHGGLNIVVDWAVPFFLAGQSKLMASEGGVA
jgi:hypothetical protein